MGHAGQVNGIAWIAAGQAHPERPSLLLVHGAGGNSSCWWQQFEAFAPGRHVIAFDLPGFGRSAAPAADEDVPQAMVRAIVDVLGALAVSRADVVCQSLGGWAGVRLALARPDLVGSLVLCCTLAGLDHAPGIAAFLSAARQMDERGPAALGLLPSFELAEPAKALLYRQIGASNPPLDPSLSARLFGPQVLLATRALADLRAPVTLIMGGKDPIWPPQSLTGMLAWAPRFRERIMPEAGHSPYFEQPDAFNALLAETLKWDH